MNNFNIELTYQFHNDTWSALIKHGNGSYLGVAHDLIEAVELGTEEFFKAHPPVCRTCGGTKKVSKMEPVYAGEPHMADIGEEACPDCCPKVEEEADDQG